MESELNHEIELGCVCVPVHSFASCVTVLLGAGVASVRFPLGNAVKRFS